MVDKVGIEESLSALMDNEAQELETRRVLRDVSSDAELRQTWHRYQLASAAMKRDLPPKMVDLSAAISDAVAAEPTHRQGIKTFLQPLGKVAIAASVALVAVLGVQQIQVSQGPAGAGALQQPQVAAAAVQPAVEEDSGAAQFQLPAGYDLPPMTARTVSAGTQYEAQPRPMLVVTRRQVPEMQDEAAIRDYLNTMMERHTRNAAVSSSSHGTLPLARLPQLGADD